MISDQSALDAVCAAHADSARVALDTEFLRERTYVAELALVQLADRERVSLIDPLAGTDLQALAGLLTDPAVTKIVHAARQDLDKGTEILDRADDAVWRAVGYLLSRIGRRH